MKRIIKHNLPLITTNFLFWAAAYIFMPVLPVFFSKSMTGLQIGILIGAYSIGSLCFRFIAGIIGDKYGHKRIAIYGIVISVFAICGYFYSTSFAVILMSRFVHGVGTALYSSSAMTMVTLNNAEEDVREGISYYTLCSMLGIGISTSIAFTLYNYTNINVIITCALGCTLLCLYIFPKIKIRHHKKTLNNEKISQKTNLIFDSKILLPTLNQFLVYFNYSVITIFFPLLLISTGYRKFVWVFFLCYVISVICSRFATKYINKKLSSYFLSLVVLIVITNVMLVASMQLSVILIVTVGIVLGFGVGISVPIFAGIITSNTPHAMRGKAMGFFTTSIDLGMGMGPILVGFLIKYVSTQHVFLLIFCFNFVYLFFYLFVNKVGHRCKQISVS